MTTEEKNNVENYYQGIYVTETILGNPNGSFVNNEPRNVKGRVFTTDKVIKYNIRSYIHERYEQITTDNGNNYQVDDFVFFYPRSNETAGEYEAKYLTKDSVFKKFFSNNFEEVLKKCPDCRMFGGTFSFAKDNKNVYGPIQLSYGLDIIGADIINIQIGTPFSTKDGQQKTKGEEKVVDNAVIAYDITVNPNNAPGLLKERDLNLFKESIFSGTNLRRSTSKKTESKLLMMIKFKGGKTLNMGELKHLISVDSQKVTDSNETSRELVLDMSKVVDKINKFSDVFSSIEVYKANHVKLTNFFDNEEDKLKVKEISDLAGVN